MQPYEHMNECLSHVLFLNLFDNLGDFQQPPAQNKKSSLLCYAYQANLEIFLLIDQLFSKAFQLSIFSVKGCSRRLNQSSISKVSMFIKKTYFQHYRILLHLFLLGMKNMSYSFHHCQSIHNYLKIINSIDFIIPIIPNFFVSMISCSWVLSNTSTFSWKIIGPESINQQRKQKRQYVSLYFLVPKKLA